MSDAAQATIQLTPKEIALLDHIQISDKSLSLEELKQGKNIGVKEDEVDTILKKLQEHELISQEKMYFKYTINRRRYNDWLKSQKRTHVQ